MATGLIPSSLNTSTPSLGLPSSNTVTGSTSSAAKPLTVTPTGVQVAAPTPKPATPAPVKTTLPALAQTTATKAPSNPLSSTQIAELDAASARIAAGTGSSTDKTNVDYAKANKGYTYTPPKAPTPVTPAVTTPTPTPTAAPAPVAPYTPTTTQFTPTNTNIGTVASNLANVSSTSTPQYTQAQQGANDVAKQLQEVSTNPYQPTQTAINGLNQLGATASPAVQQAIDNIAAVKNEYAQKGININQTAGFLTQAGGEQGMLQNQYLTALDAAQSSLASALAQQNQQIGAYSAAGGLGNTYQGNIQSGLNNAGGIYNNVASNATGQQGTQQSGLASAGALVAPISQFGLLTNPATGQPISPDAGGNLNPLNSIDKIAQQVISGQISPSDAEALGGSVTNFPAALNAAILKLNPNYNRAAAEGAYAANASNTQVGGTAATTAAQGVLNSQIQNLSNLQVANSNVKQFGDQVLQNMSSLGLTDSQSANKKLNEIQTEFSDPKYAQFNANIQGLQARVSSLLSIGELPTAATEGAQSIVNGNISMGAMASTLAQLNAEGDALIKSTQDQVNAAQQVIAGSGGSSSTGGGSTGGSSSIFSW